MNQDWHMNKSVPLTLVFAIVIQTMSLVWFISQLNSAVEANTSDIVVVQAEVKVMETLIQGQAVYIARIDENLKAIRDAVDRLSHPTGGR